MKKQILSMSALSASILLITACGDGGGHGGEGGPFGGGSFDVELSFDLSNAVALIANEDPVTTERHASRGLFGQRNLYSYAIARNGDGTGEGDSCNYDDGQGGDHSGDHGGDHSGDHGGDAMGGQGGEHGGQGEECYEGASNLLAVDAAGNAAPAVDTNVPMKVMYSVASPDGSKVYMALDTGWDSYDGSGFDYSKLIAHTNCALLEVDVATDEHSCVSEGKFVQSMDDDYMKAISGNQKPIQFDNEGNMYFAATTFTRMDNSWEDCWWDDAKDEEVCEVFEDYWIDSWGDWNPRVYRYNSNTGDVAAVSQDTEYVGFFLVLPSGELVYQSWDNQNGGNTLKMIRSNGEATPLTSDDSWISFFAVDSSNTVLYGTHNWNSNDSGIQMARPQSNGLTQFANLDTALFGSNSQNSGWQNPTPQRVILGDDGRLYGVFEGGRDNYDPVTDTWTWSQTLKVFQILPFDPVPKVELDLGNDWWLWMGKTPFQIANGYLYYTEEVSVPGYNAADVVRMVELETREVTTLLHPVESYSPLVIGDRYQMYSWRLSGDILYFSALNLGNNTVVMGELDTTAIDGATSVADYLIVQETASAAGAASAVQDIEVITAVAAGDNGAAPSVVEIFNDPENMFSMSIDFSEPMDHSSVEAALTLTSDVTTEGDGGNIPYLPLWIGSTMHLVPDLQNSETNVNPWVPSLALLYPTTMPMNFESTYTLGGFATSMTDVAGNAMTVPTFSNGENAVTIRKERGWYTSGLTETVSSNLADGDLMKFAARFDEYNWKDYTLHNDLPEHFRVEFSAINFGWEGVQLVIFDQENRNRRGSDDIWADMLMKMRLGHWSDMSYQTSRTWNGVDTYWGNNDWENGETRDAFNSNWARYRIDVYGNNIEISVSADGTTFETLEVTGSDPVETFSFSNFVGLADANDDGNSDTEYHLVLRSVSALAMDNLQMTTLLANGAIATTAGDLMDEDGSTLPTLFNTAANYGLENW